MSGRQAAPALAGTARASSNRVAAMNRNATVAKLLGGGSMDAISDVPTPLVALRQAQRMLGHVVQDHLARNGGGPREPHAPPHVAEPVLEGEAVAAVGLDRAVDALDRRLGRRVLGHVRGLARARRAGVVERGR